MAGLLTAPALSAEAELAATIRQWASTPCSPFPCGEEVWAYAARVCRRAAPRLPRHRTHAEVARLLRREGGLPAYAARLMASIGWDHVARPARGDVGLVDIPAMGLTCAICLEAGEPDALWMAKGARQLLVITAPHIDVWRMPCPRR